MFGDFYGDESILVTGHTGFKGAWLSLWLRELGARVHGFSIGTVGRPSFYETLGKKLFESDARGDVRDLGALKKLIRRTKPRMIFHLAAQPLVRRSYQEPLETLTTNALGTANVLEAVRLTGCAASIIVVTTDKCYENRNLKRGYREADPLGGHDVYSASK
ncbi:MAG: GDP-mannose 4,6-dehydratase, partial [Limisphaerales bacterium]